jgi:hypothetical protein
MTATKDEVLHLILEHLNSNIDHKRFGEYGIFVTMHDGFPVKITEVNQMSIHKPKERLEVTK